MIELDPAVVRSDAVLMGAVDFGHHELVEWLLARGAERQRANDELSRAIRLCIRPHGTVICRWSASSLARAPTSSARDEEHDGTPLGWAEVAIDATNNPKCRERWSSTLRRT